MGEPHRSRREPAARAPGQARSLDVLAPPEESPTLEDPDGREHA